MDVDVSEKGAQEAVNAGRLMRDANLSQGNSESGQRGVDLMDFAGFLKGILMLLLHCMFYS